MMNELKLFNNDEFGQIRVIEIEGKPYFIANDVARALGYTTPKDAITRHCKGALKQRYLTEGGEQEIKVIPEGDVYRLIVKSKLPTAEKFEKWVFDEVLPTIRKHGAYITPQKLEEAILNPDTMIKLCEALKNEQDKNKTLQIANSKLTVENQIMQPKADYFDELVDRNLLTNFRDTAKMLEIKQKEFINFLLDKKLCISR